ncbi:Lipopolysaccharide biosynthesis regulator YciM, contains six TPR domains and a predicted metal-binding C-terminal domain [Salinibacillus kushneri]|uniref:Lipopolysaccharide biosynthesis regulator YciM, contains six TPR domains and a predicted metal-binding C-terminal domain n=1 Tax=Salinibacillus kushneri TaxID=237682 RepID=A0A1I0I196_9BACI|nr:tetratricopeptide repeat protein [Salinibacillus kushneri]SET90378.1 Lipopolysaccharide biosynthesis regulator YciM, contains six TPR domains and a predicted metal-binding C-terminal domain [Salinibacillus kushneri]
MHIIEEARQQVEQGNTEKGLKLLQSYESEANDDERFNIALLYHQWGLLEQAEKLFLQLMDKYPKEGELKLYLAEIYVDKEQDDQAIEILNQFDKDDDYYIPSLMELADLYQSQGLYEVAEHKLLEAKQILPNEPVIDFALGELFFVSGEYKKSIPHYEKALKGDTTYNDVNVEHRLAEALALIGDWEKALEYFQTSDQTDSPDILFRYGFTAYQSERMDIAINMWEKVLEADPYYQSVYSLLAKAYEQEGLLEKAYETAKKGLKEDELNKELLFFSGQIANQLGKLDEAFEDLQEAIAIDPGYKEAVVALVELYKNEEDHENIKDLLENLKQEDELDPLYQWELAKAYYELEEYDLALNNYKEAYNAFTNDADFLKEYGYMLVEEGRMKEAKEVLSKYLSIEPSDTYVEEFVLRLNQ